MLATIVFVSVLITFVGTSIIYRNSKNGIEREIVAAAGTLENLFEKEFPGDLNSSSYFIYRFGERVVVAEDFYNIVEYISCSEDIEFTVFYGDMRIFTTVVNPSGSTPVGTRAMEIVAEEVIGGKQTHVYDNIDINGTIYMGCYIPIVSSDGTVSGMYFAGRPLETANENVVLAIVRFILIACITLLISVVSCVFFTDAMIKDLGDIKQYISKIANGDFSAHMKKKTLERDDEIGDMGRNAETLCTNLQDMVERDPLTTLLNRRSCLKKLNELMDGRQHYTVVMGDIDYFKRINDTYGHACGDYILREVSAVLKAHGESSDAFVSRWGGEEFLMVFNDKNSTETLVIVEQILDEIRNAAYSYDEKKINVTMTFGISQVQEGDNAESAVNRADKLLYKGKEAGRNRIVM